MRHVLTALVATACSSQSSQSPSDDGWIALDVPEADDVLFADASGIGDTVVAVGVRGSSGAVLMTDGQDWQMLDTPELPPLARVFAAADDDVWVIAHEVPDSTPSIWRWDGAIWSAIEAPQEIAGATDVWGTGPNDVWIAAYAVSEPLAVAFQWDGAAWTVHDTFSDLLDVEQGELDSLGLPAGCSSDVDQVWVMGTFYQGLTSTGESFRRAGSEWTTSHWSGEEDANPLEVVCSGERAWSIGHSVLGPLAQEWRSGAWTPVPLPERANSHVRIDGIWASDEGEAWIVGEESDSPDISRGRTLQAWHLTADGASATMVEPRPVAEAVPTFVTGLSAVWQTDAGRVLAFGSEGLVLEYQSLP